MSDKADRCSVNVSMQAEALCDPTFIIKAKGRFYVTLALWEYDPNDPHAQKHDIAELERLIEEARAKGELHEAAKSGRRAVCFYGSTNPPGGGGIHP